MRVVVLHDNPEWYAPIKQAFEQEGLQVEEWLADDTVVDVTSPPPDDVIVYNRTCASSHTRGRPRSLDQARTVLRWLEQHNVAVVNGLAALELENSKAWQYMIAQQYGLKVPRSLFTTLPTVHQIEKEFGKDTPFLVKPDRGGRGASVRMYQNVDDFRYDTSGLVSTTGLYVLQEYIPADDGIYRMEFVGDEYLYTSLAKPKTSCSFDPNMCPCDLPSSRFTILEDFHHPILHDCAHFLRQVGLDVAAFEVIFDSSGEGHVIDVNTVTGYNMAAEKKAGVEGGVKALAKYVASRAVSAKKNFETDY